MSPEPSDLHRATLSGFGWKVSAELLTQATRLAVMVLLARLLTPTDFGLAALVLALAVFVPAFSDLALGAALIHKRTIDDVDCSTMFWATLPLGAIVTAVVIALAWPLSHLYHSGSVRPLIIVFSFAFLIGSLSSTPTALLTRNMNFRALEIRVILATIAGAVTSLSLAVAGFGAWAIVVGELALRTTALVLLWVQSPWRPSLTFSRRALREMGGYSSGVFGAYFLVQTAPALQNLTAARLIGAKGLGTLSLSQQVVMLPFNRIAAPIQEVLFPAFSRMQDEPRRISAAWFKANQVVATIAVPALLGLAVVADDFVHVILGAQWANAVLPLRIFALAGIALALQRLNMSILQARARTRALTSLAASGAVSTVVAVIIGSRWGIDGVAVLLTVQALVVQLTYMAVTARSVEVTLLDALAPLGRIVIAGLVMAAAVAVTQAGLREAGVAPGLRLGLDIVVGGVVYAGAFLILCRDLFRDLSQIGRRVVSPMKVGVSRRWSSRVSNH